MSAPRRLGRTARGRLAALASVLALAFANAAGAASITSLTVALSPTNSTNLLVDTNPPPVTRVRQSSVAVGSSSANSFSTRYAMLVGTDIGNNPTISETFTADYTITLQISAGLGENWQLQLASNRVGALTIVNDGGGSASATLGAVTGLAAGGTLSGSLNMAAVGTTTNSAANTTSPNTPFSQFASAVLSGVGTGGVQVVSLRFQWTAGTTSTRGGNNGDEAAVRMGLASTASFFTADDYPGAGGRTQSGDGHFVTALLIPEPATAFLLTSGLLGLAWSSRKRS